MLSGLVKLWFQQQPGNWRQLLMKWSLSRRDLAVRRRKGSRIKAGSVFLSIFHQTASRNFVQRFHRWSGKRCRGRRPRLQQRKNRDRGSRLQGRRRVSSCKSSRRQQAGQSDRVMFLKERRSPVRRIFSLFSCEPPTTHVAFAAMGVLNQLDTGNRRRTGDRRSLEE